MKLSTVNNQPSTAKPAFNGNLAGSLPTELKKYSKEVNAYAKKAFKSLPNDVVLSEEISKEGKILVAKTNFTNCYSSNIIAVSMIKSFDDLKKFINEIKTEADGLIFAQKKCGYIK